jgi:hypothetical protein
MSACASVSEDVDMNSNRQNVLAILAGAQGAIADDAVDRRRDGGVFDIELGLALRGLRAQKRRIGLDDLGLQQVDLLQCGGEVGGVARDRGLGAGDARLRLLGVLHAAIAGRSQVGVALVLLGGEVRGGLIDIDGRGGGVDHRLLNAELGFLAGDRGPRRGDIGTGLGGVEGT